MVAARNTETHPLMKGCWRNAKAYVAYAQARPGMYGLMFRTERIDMTPALAARGSDRLLRRAWRTRSAPSRNEKLTAGWRRCRSDQAAAIARAHGRWCTASPRCCSTDG